METMVEKRTMSVVKDELNTSVDKYNEATDAAVRVQLNSEHKKLVEEYNQLSLLSTYAKFMQDEMPLIALAKAYYYDTVSIKDAVHNEAVEGVQTSSVTRSINEGVRKLDVTKFIAWAGECNKTITHSKTWKTDMMAARTAIETEWKKFFAAKGDSHAMSIGKTKRALQTMFDALVFVPCEKSKDKNAIIANGDIAKWVLGFANNRKDIKVDGKIAITGNVLSKQTWNVLCLDILHKAVTGKSYEIIYGEPEEEVNDDVEVTKAEESKK